MIKDGFFDARYKEVLKAKNILTCIILALVLLISLACSVVLLVYGNSYVICFGTPFPSLVSVEQNAYLRFPSSVRNIEYDANGVNRKAGCTIWVKFEMDNSELDSFLNTTVVQQISASIPSFEGGFDYWMSVKGWSQPEGALLGHSPVDPKTHDGFVYADQWIVVDVTNSEQPAVYLIVNKEWL